MLTVSCTSDVIEWRIHQHKPWYTTSLLSHSLCKDPQVLQVHLRHRRSTIGAVQWHRLFCNLCCTSSGRLIEPSIIFSQLHLAQWHALLALKHTGVRVSIEEAVVAYASHRILANYFPFQLDLAVDPLLQGQLNTLQLSESEEKLGKRLAQAVAIDLLRKHITAR